MICQDMPLKVLLGSKDVMEAIQMIKYEKIVKKRNKTSKDS
jgi:hypothetical protein